MHPRSKSIYNRLLFLTGKADSEGARKGGKLVIVGIFRQQAPGQKVRFCPTKTPQKFSKNQEFFPRLALALRFEAIRTVLTQKISAKKLEQKLNLYQYFS
ncbi:hypothetical protein [Herbaspirillum sp. CF444]|uniref:hypothetical protein n=1 Tax=Herbaspirillum sp. CF444 TaxID=1144319 RepID=UPI0012F95F13|nr:hypothetical protein [Herbaspirillum sp. CF444]